jgi:hypothetical protein
MQALAKPLRINSIGQDNTALHLLICLNLTYSRLRVLMLSCSHCPNLGELFIIQCIEFAASIRTVILEPHMVLEL